MSVVRSTITLTEKRATFCTTSFITHADTTASDNVYEAITEVESGGKPSNRYSLLEHTWTINIGAGGNPVLVVEAHHSANSEGDDFVFGYSTDNVNFTDVITVTKTSDDDISQGAALPGGLTGTIYIRVTDTDSTAGNNVMDTVYVDQLYIETSSGGGPNNPPSFNSNPIIEINATEGQSYSSTLSDDATDPDFDTLSFSKVSGPAWLVVSSNGDLSGTPGAGDLGLNSFTVEVDDGNGGTDQATLEITVDPAGSQPDIYVFDIAMSSGAYGGNRYSGIATITIKDDGGAVVSGATVYVDWSGATSESQSNVTDANGQVVLESSKVKNGGTYTVTVTNVSKSGTNYNPTLNIETSDSITAP